MAVHVDTDGAVLTITLDRPEQLNAVTREQHRELATALEEARADEVRAVIITGAGRAFCVGQDLEEVRAERGDETAAATTRACARDTTPTFAPSARSRSLCSPPSTAWPPGRACRWRLPVTSGSPPRRPSSYPPSSTSD